jgi:hypothetical protein
MTEFATRPLFTTVRYATKRRVEWQGSRPR